MEQKNSVFGHFSRSSEDLEFKHPEQKINSNEIRFREPNMGSTLCIYANIEVPVTFGLLLTLINTTLIFFK